MSLVQFDLTFDASGDKEAFFLSALSTRSYAALDLGAVHIVDPATGRAYLPAYDSGGYTRVLCTYAKEMAGGAAYRYAVLTGGLPAGVTSVTVSLGVFGTAKAVPVQQ
jgi:hypothetical protein